MVCLPQRYFIDASENAPANVLIYLVGYVYKSSEHGVLDGHLVFEQAYKNME